jgi:hypothetical protein
MSADQIASLRQAIKKAEASHLNKSDVAKLKSMAATVGVNAGTAKNAADSSRMKALAEILEAPSM